MFVLSSKNIIYECSLNVQNAQRFQMFYKVFMDVNGMFQCIILQTS